MENDIKDDDLQVGTCPVHLLISNLRALESDHEPEGWPAVQMKEISKLCEVVENIVPALDLLQSKLYQGAMISHQDDLWWLFDKSGEVICNGLTIRLMLISLILRPANDKG